MLPTHRLLLLTEIPILKQFLQTYQVRYELRTLRVLVRVLENYFNQKHLQKDDIGSFRSSGTHNLLSFCLQYMAGL